MTESKTPPQNFASMINGLVGLPLGLLRATWAAEFRMAPLKTLSRDLLVRTLAWHLQEKTFGGHDRETEKLLNSLARGKADPGMRRLKAGTVLVREYQGKRHTVAVAQDGFIWEEKAYPNLTLIARTITGTNWNGPRFFGLREAGTKRRQVEAER